jgi:hypothetical protein
MSLFQCEICGCVENTALSFQGVKPMADDFDFTGIEDRKNKLLCSECAPTKFDDGTLTGLGTWHGRFDKKYLPLGMFKTNKSGDLEHIETGDTSYGKYRINKD